MSQPCEKLPWASRLAALIYRTNARPDCLEAVALRYQTAPPHQGGTECLDLEPPAARYLAVPGRWGKAPQLPYTNPEEPWCEHVARPV